MKVEMKIRYKVQREKVQHEVLARNGLKWQKRATERVWVSRRDGERGRISSREKCGEWSTGPLSTHPVQME